MRLWIDAKTCSIQVGRAPPTHFSPKDVVTEGVAEGCEALVEDLLAVSDEQQPRSAEPFTEAGGVEGGHDGLARTGGGDGEVAVMASLPGHLDQLEQPVLEGVRSQLDRAQDHVRAGVGAPGARLLVLELLGVEWETVAAGPVALEHGAELGDHVGIARGRGPHIPLDAGHLGRVGEVRRADVRSREAGVAMEHPCLGVEAGGGVGVGHPDVGAEVDELVQRVDPV